MIRQYGTVAWKRGVKERPLVLLITSRDTGRWVVPRGNPIPGLPPHLSAAQEAFEEAGVRGPVTSEVVGEYGYRKTRRSGRGVRARVVLFPLRVEEELAEWPEAGERTRRWFAPAAAAEAVLEPELKALLAGFVPPN
ncbi:MAG TPA: NUDIX hydrolase [Allosphingosinicella sp.]